MQLLAALTDVLGTINSIFEVAKPGRVPASQVNSPPGTNVAPIRSFVGMKR